MTKMKMAEKYHKRRDESFQNSFIVSYFLGKVLSVRVFVSGFAEFYSL